MYGLPLRCKATSEVMAKTVCVNVSGLLVEARGLLALMEYARTGPHNAGGHERPVYRSG